VYGTKNLHAKTSASRIGLAVKHNGLVSISIWSTYKSTKSIHTYDYLPEHPTISLNIRICEVNPIARKFPVPTMFGSTP
jgi:hypothetical protein